LNSLDIQLSLRHEVGRAKWTRELFREQPPPFLGPLVTIKEAAAALSRSEAYVRSRIDDGRLNTWKDQTSKRVWILKDDLDLLLGDNAALQEQRQTRRRGDRETRSRSANPQSAIENPQSEDLDAIGGWVAPEPRGAAGYLEQKEKESEARYAQKQRENEEWYAAELAKLEDRDPVEAVRQLQIERGWLTSDPPLGTLMKLAAESRAAKQPRKRPESARPISWSDPNAKPRTPPEPYADPDDQSAIPNPQSAIDRPFPIGWVSSKVACSMLQVCRVRLTQYVKEGRLQRRFRPDGKLRYLYDSVELERLAEQRLERQATLLPNESYSHWGPRSHKIELNEFDGWISSSEAANMLGITRQRVFEIIREGKLPCYQKDPGKQGSRVFVPHNMVIRLRDNPIRHKRREACASGISAPEPQDRGWEEQGIEPYQQSDSTPNTRRDRGEFYTARQTAQLLGISVGTVHRLRLRGRLVGHHHTPRKVRIRPWWFFRKEDVHNLQADPEYTRHHKRYRKQFDKIWQDTPAPESAAPPAQPSDAGWSWDDADLPAW